MPRRTRAPKGPGGPGAHGQRTDLNKSAGASPVQAPAAPTGMAYGAHKETIESQRAIPLPASPPIGPAGPAAGGTGGGGLMEALAAAAAHPAPGGGLGAPTQRPNEPITAGLSTGLGPGPAPTSSPRAADYLARLAADGGDPAMLETAALARRLGA